MKHVYRVFIYYIIRNFNKVSSGIISDYQPFVYIRFEQLFMERVPHGITDVDFRYTVLEGGLIELNNWKHGFSLALLAVCTANALNVVL
ncbi:MAG: hypothetical protein LBK44_03810 [Spirochaetales bacterium]|nr:hypothetical protein [Spirochaetales bacterium]